MEIAIEAFNNETRKYTDVTGKPADDAFKVLTFKNILPDKIRVMLQTADHATYLACMDYVVKQARVIQNGIAATEPAAGGPSLDAATKEGTAGTAKDTSPSYTPEEQEQ